MEIRIEGNVEELGDQVAALAELFRPTGPEIGIQTGLSALSSPEPAVIAPAPDPSPTRVPVVDVAELDVDNQPWNGEIHSSNRSRKKDGRWTARRGADPARTAAIYAEWTARAATVEVAGPPPPPPVIPPGMSTGVVPSPPPPPPLGISTPTLPLAPPAPITEDPLTGCIRVAAAIMALTDDPGQKAVYGQRLNTVMAQSGLQGLPMLQANPQLAPAVLLGLQALAAELGVQC